MKIQDTLNGFFREVLILLLTLLFIPTAWPSPLPETSEKDQRSAIDIFNDSLSNFDQEMAKERVSISKPKYLVQVIYILPEGASARPEYLKIIKIIFTHIQKHYHQQLGVTFELKEPLVRTIRSPLNAKQIRHSLFSDKGIIRTRLHKDYYQDKNLIFSIIEGDNTHGLGGINIAKPGFLWNWSYETYKKDPEALVNTLTGWSHEIGHALGLGHTAEWTVPCLARYGINIGKLDPEGIMRSGGTRKRYFLVYNHTFIDEEKKLLLDQNYDPNCRMFSESERPHSVNFLRIKLPEKN